MTSRKKSHAFKIFLQVKIFLGAPWKKAMTFMCLVNDEFKTI